MAKEELLPRSKDWRWRPYDFSTFSLAVGEKRTLIDLRRHGWVVYGVVMLNDPTVNCVIELESGTEAYRNEFTTNDLMVGDLIQPQPTGWWVSRYNNIIPIYCVNFTPAQWWPFYRRLEISLENRSGNIATVYRAAVLCIEFIEEVLP